MNKIEGNRKMQIECRFGALCKPIKEQIPQLNDNDAENFQTHADAIVRLNLHGIMTDTETHKARERLIKLIAEMV
ncbi:MAG: hypothetical protein KAI73_12140 [Rhodospirillaceae bacterium]|nr:hypothetical protein [Rhodospirillaceae bacterium]